MCLGGIALRIMGFFFLGRLFGCLDRISVVFRMLLGCVTQFTIVGYIANSVHRESAKNKISGTLMLFCNDRTESIRRCRISTRNNSIRATCSLQCLL